MDRYICIHGHFYQPPRENAWLEEVELQDSAYPYHDWNDRINAECYAANADSRILNGYGKITGIVNNYSRMSFNFGPTLLAWMKEKAPDVYQRILLADEESREMFSGHGSALAQSYNHMIMPLASERDKATQIQWGIEDFRHRFGRDPEGMWLAETAVDLQTLDLMARAGLRFTILSPFQASRTRHPDAPDWEDVSDARIDPTTPYSVSLPSGLPFSLFFYDGMISKAVAFEGILNRGEAFAERLMSGFSDHRNGAQILNIATDGESYGHHHRHGDMALAYALNTISSGGSAKITNYGEFLEKYPPVKEVQIFENSSWSCPHGVERWRNDCGCNSGGNRDWRQTWRKPLREALDWLRDSVNPLYEEKGKTLFHDPWQARNAYINVLLDRSPEVVDAFLQQHAVASLSEKEKKNCMKLMELQRHAMLMYTSCGWFFDELSGIETVQVIQYAGRVLQIAADVFGKDLEPEFLDMMEKAPSNIYDHKNGRRIYEKFVKSAMVDLKTVCAHHAISSLFDECGQTGELFCYRVKQEDCRKEQVGNKKLTMGKAVIHSKTTLESDRFCFGVLHWGDHNIAGCVRNCEKDEVKEAETASIFETFTRAAFPETLQQMETLMGPAGYSLRTLFKDQQRRMTNEILAATLENTRAIYRQVYENSTPLLRFLNVAGMPAPKALVTAGEVVVNADLSETIENEDFDPEKIHRIIEDSALSGLTMDAATLEMIFRKRLEHISIALHSAPDDMELMRQLDTLLCVLSDFPFEVNLRVVQNNVYDLMIRVYPDFKRPGSTDPQTREWIELFESICEKLGLEISS